jgi:S1-C subfamily serine protease
VEALDASLVGSAPAISPVVGVEQVGPYESTVAGLVDVNARIPGGTAAGTGIVLSPDGVVVTNNHVVVKASTIVATDLADGRDYPVTVLGRDPGHDVAVIRLIGASGLPVAPIGDSDQLKVGDRVAAIGNAGGRGGRPTITTGEVTALDQSIVAADDSTHQRRRLHGMIQVSASVQPGDSGGALVGATGVIGMNTATSPGAGFAIPINTVIAIAHKIEAGEPSRPDLSEFSTQRSVAASSGRVGVTRVATRSRGD